MKTTRLFVVALALSGEVAFAGMTTLGESSGEKSQYNGIQACAKLGKHLPTIRELAQVGVANGAHILEVSDIKGGRVPDGFVTVSAINGDKSTDLFYYSGAGYIRPEKALIELVYSSSGDSITPSWPFLFDPGLGIIAIDTEDGWNGVHTIRCFTNK